MLDGAAIESRATIPASRKFETQVYGSTALGRSPGLSISPVPHAQPDMHRDEHEQRPRRRAVDQEPEAAEAVQPGFEVHLAAGLDEPPGFLELLA